MSNLGVYAASPAYYTVNRKDDKGQHHIYTFNLVVTQSNLRAFKCICGWESLIFSLRQTIDPPSEVLQSMHQHVEDHLKSVSLTPTTTEIQ